MFRSKDRGKYSKAVVMSFLNLPLHALTIKYSIKSTAEFANSIVKCKFVRIFIR